MVGRKRQLRTGSEITKEGHIALRQRSGFPHLPTSPVNQILFFQRTLGNQAVQRLLATGAIQTKLRIGQPNGIYEQEADRVTEHVMRMPEPRIERQCTGCEVGLQGQSMGEKDEEGRLQRKPLAEKKTPLVQRQFEPEEEKELIQPKTTGDVMGEATPAISSSVQSLQSGGRPLSESERSFFEPRFSADFSNVRIHNDTRVARLAQSVNARAFTFGHNVVFGAGEYYSESLPGRKLFAHELTHVMQQNAGHPSFSTEKKSENTGRYSQGLPHRSSHRTGSLAITPVTHTLLSRIRIRDCSTTSTPAQDPQEVQAAHDRALEMLNDAISLSNSPNPSSDVITAANVFFGITVPPSTNAARNSWDHVLRNLNRMVPDYNQMYQCGPQSGRRCSAGDIAWTVFRIHLCNPWWVNFSDVDKRAAILLHEWVHGSGIMWSRRRDIYCYQPTYTSLTTGQRLDLPDAYMQYIYRLYTGGDFCWV